MRALLVSDLHYELPKLDWVLAQAGQVDLLVLAGDFLNIASPVPLDAQITVVLEYLARCAELTTTVACSGNHDLDHRRESGEKATGWLAGARDRGITVDGDSVRVGGWTVTACAWWEGPDTLRALEERLQAAAALSDGRWLWAWHGPPEGRLSWTGKRHFGDPELPRLLDRFRPDVVLCGHIHEAPYQPEGGWFEQRGGTWLFNGGHQHGPVPSHVSLDLDRRQASWWSFAGEAEVSFAEDEAPDQ